MLNLRMNMPLYLMSVYGGIMIIVVLIMRAFIKEKLPKFVFPAIWGIILIRLIIPFSLSSPISAPVPYLPSYQTADTAVTVIESSAQTTLPMNSPTAVAYDSGSYYDYFDNMYVIIPVIYCMGVLISAVILIRQKMKYSQTLKDSLLVENNETINSILRDMGMGHILVFTNDNIASPLVSGVLKPVIYLPTKMNFQNIILLRHILTHEIMHIKRRDNWFKTAMMAALCLNWFNPLVWVMSKYVPSDLEAACDEAVLNTINEDQRQNYAGSLLAMAITGNRSTLLYSAFSKTEVERRIKRVLEYKKATTLTLVLSLTLVLFSTAVFATGGQAPFEQYFSSYCSSENCKWGIEVELARDIPLRNNSSYLADKIILDILSKDKTNDPEIIEDAVLSALSKEFKVEKGAFKVRSYLNLNNEDVMKEYAEYELKKGSDGFYIYRGESVRTYYDELLGSAQNRDSGDVDITVIRDKLGNITSINALYKGDNKFDERTKEIENRKEYLSYSGYSEATSTDTEYSQENYSDTIVQTAY